MSKKKYEFLTGELWVYFTLIIVKNEKASFFQNKVNPTAKTRFQVPSIVTEPETEISLSVARIYSFFSFFEFTIFLFFFSSLFLMLVLHCQLGNNIIKGTQHKWAWLLCPDHICLLPYPCTGLIPIAIFQRNITCNTDPAGKYKVYASTNWIRTTFDIWFPQF